MTKNRLRTITVLGCGLATLALGGCLGPQDVSTAPGLEGDWYAELTNDTEAVFTFDEDGALTKIRVENVAGAAATFNVRRSTTTLEGDQVTIEAPMGLSGTSTYAGTLSADQKRIEGAWSREIEVSNALSFTIPSGELMLVRTSDCNDNGEYDHREIADDSAQDCNANDIPDECDISDGDSLDANSNGIPDECEQA